MIVDELVAVLGYDLQGEDKLRRFTGGVDKAESRLRKFAVTAAKVGAAVGAAIGASMAYIGKSVISTSAEFESYQATLETIEGSAEKAKASLDWVAEFARTTPYELSEVTQSFVRLKAYGLDPMDGSLKAVGDAGSAMGKSLMAGVEAIADAVTGEFERLKEFGVRASVEGDNVTFSWIENGKTLTKTIKKQGDEIGRFLTQNFQRFDGAMDKQSKTWNGMVSNLSDTWQDFLRRIGSAGFFDAMKRRLQGVLDLFERLDKDGSLDRWAKRISTALTTAVNVTGRLFDRLFTIAEKLGSLFGGTAGLGFAISAGALAVYLFPVLSVMTALVLLAEDFWSWMEGGESIIGDIVKKVQELIEAFKELVGLGKDTKVQPALPPVITTNEELLKDPSYTPYGDKDFIEDYVRKNNDQARPPVEMTPDAEDWKWKLQQEEGKRIEGMLENLNGNLAKMSDGAGANATITDARTDARDQSVTVQVGGVEVNVQQPAAAPAVTGAAVGNAVGQAAAGAVSRIEQEPASP